MSHQWNATEVGDLLGFSGGGSVFRGSSFESFLTRPKKTTGFLLSQVDRMSQGVLARHLSFFFLARYVIFVGVGHSMISLSVLESQRKCTADSFMTLLGSGQPHSSRGGFIRLLSMECLLLPYFVRFQVRTHA